MMAFSAFPVINKTSISGRKPGVIIKQGWDNVLLPMRYACRPAGKPKFYNKKFPGLYNARRDNLDRFWSEQFGRHHALIVADCFYENVKLHMKEHRESIEGEIDQNVVLQFTPTPPQAMLIACLLSRWTDPNEPHLLGSRRSLTSHPRMFRQRGMTALTVYYWKGSRMRKRVQSEPV